jgi:hypothetical protein
MTKKLQISLNEQATENYLLWARSQVEAEINADCEPSGVCIRVDIDPTCFPSEASTTDAQITFGDCDVCLIED